MKLFYSHLKMASERSKRRDFLSLSFIAKSISTKLLIKINENVPLNIRVVARYMG